MRNNHIKSNESGFMMVGTLLVLIAVTAIGVTLINVSNFEIDITTSEKCKEEARYNSESCTIAGAKLVKLIAEEASENGELGIAQGNVRVAGVTYGASVHGYSVEEEIARKILDPGLAGESVCEDFFLTPVGVNMDATANIIPQGIKATHGTASLRQVSGYSYGIGLGGFGGGGFANWVMLACRGGGCNSSARHISYSRYKRIPGMSGGF